MIAGQEDIEHTKQEIVISWGFSYDNERWLKPDSIFLYSAEWKTKQNITYLTHKGEYHYRDMLAVWTYKIYITLYYI